MSLSLRLLLLASLLLTFHSAPKARADEAPAPAPAPEDDRPVTREEYEKLLEEMSRLQLLFAENESGKSAGSRESGSRLPGNKGGLYDKPFLSEFWSSVHIGGYFDIEYRDAEGSRHDFRFHRLIPFIYADIHERVRFATEIEIEDGVDLAVEFAYLDVLFTDQVNFRGGVILDPLGKFNLIHDSPINDLTDRPLVNRFVIPTTLRELGVGLFGTLTQPESTVEVKYEIYVVSGFKGLDNSGSTAINNSGGLRSARPHTTALGTGRLDDNNDHFATVGRVSVSPQLGSEFGLSAHSGAYDQKADNNLTTVALDALYTFPQFQVGDVPVGPLEIQGEGAYAFIERDDFARTSGIPGDLWGYYVQTNYHFMPDCFIEDLPLVFWPESTFTFVTRWDQVDLDGNRMRRLTVGLNFRPIESTVFKFDYQFNQGKGTAPASADDDAFVFSISSYF